MDKIYKLLSKIGIEGKKNLKLLSIMYAVLLVVTVCFYKEMPVELIYIVFVFPFAFLGVAFTLVYLRAFLLYCYSKMSYSGFILFCLIIFGVWSMILTLWYTQIDLDNSLHFAVWFIVVFGMAGFFSVNLMIYWISRLDGKKKKVLFLFIHLGLFIGMWALFKQTDSNGLFESCLFSDMLSAVFIIQLAAYCLISFWTCFGVLVYSISRALLGNEKK